MACCDVRLLRVPACHTGGSARSRHISFPGFALLAKLREERLEVGVQALQLVGDLGHRRFVLLARTNANGQLDPAFSDDGKETTTAPSPNSIFGYDAALTTDGKLVVAAGGNLNGLGAMMVARYKSDGRLDSTFNGGFNLGFGLVVATSFPHSTDTKALALDNSNRPVLIGNMFNP